MNMLFMWILDRGIELGGVILFLLPLRAVLKRKAPKIFSYLLWGALPIGLCYNLITLLLPEFSYHVQTFHCFEAIMMPDRGFDLCCEIVMAAGMLALLVYEIFSYAALRGCLVGSIRLRGNIYMTSRIKGPFTMGVRTPQIYLPNSLEEKHLEYVIAHEEIHIARKDVLLRCIGSVLRMIFWFQPLIWVAYYLFVNDMEDACDEAVLRNRSREYQIRYAETLVEVSYQAGKAGRATVGYGGGEVKKRVGYVLRYKKHRRAAIIGAAVACIAVVCVAIPVAGKLPRVFRTTREGAKPFSIEILTRDAAEWWK